MFPQLVEPEVQVLKGVLVGQVENHKGTQRIPIILACYGVVALLTGSVPDLQLYRVRYIGFSNLNGFPRELDSKGLL